MILGLDNLEMLLILEEENKIVFILALSFLYPTSNPPPNPIANPPPII